MDETRQSLVLRAQNGEETAWKVLMDLYRPLIIGWLNNQGVPPYDLEDLSQDILLTVVKHLPTFQHSGHRGAFRTWLRTIARSRSSDYRRSLDAGRRLPDQRPPAWLMALKTLLALLRRVVLPL
jgi:RNA polymerase sigma-70 factor (ECF subfamily)